MGNNHSPKTARFYDLRNQEWSICKQAKWPSVPHVKPRWREMNFDDKVEANHACWSARHKLWAWKQLMDGHNIDKTISDLDIQPDYGFTLPGDVLYGHSWVYKYWDLRGELIAMKNDPRLK